MRWRSPAVHSDSELLATDVLCSMKWPNKGKFKVCISKQLCRGESVRWIEVGASETERAAQSGCECELSRGEAVKLSIKR